MTVKIKLTTRAKPYEARFDFVSNAEHGEQTATIKELLAELNAQKGDQSFADYDLKSLGTVLRFVSSVFGLEVRRIGQTLPVAAIKIIKLLFKSNQFVDSHLIRVIEMPGRNSPATLDFFTSPATPENDDVKRNITRMVSLLAREIDGKELASIDEICNPLRLREKSTQDTNEAVNKILLTHIPLDDELIELADGYLADKTRAFLASSEGLKREPRLHVAMYTYLKLLDYVHRLHFEVSMQFSIPNDVGVANKRIDFTEICAKLSASEKRSISPSTNFLSTRSAVGFVKDYESNIAQLVSKSTGFKYNKRDVVNDGVRASVALQLYLYAAGLLNDEAKNPVGIVHVVAAFCSVLHQRKMKSKPVGNSKKYGAKLSSPQKQLDSFIADPETHFPLTAQYIYTERTKWYVEALLGRRHKADAHVALLIAQNEWAKDVFLSLDHMRIRRQIAAYREFITRAARDFVAMHDRQSAVYQWRHFD